MTDQAPRKFMFDTVFDHGKVIEAPRPRRAFTVEEVEAARAEAYAQGERSATVQVEQQVAASLADIAQTVRQAVGALAHLAHEHRTASAELALACARRIADAALDQFPNAPAEAALAALAGELTAEPRLMVRASPEEADRLREVLSAAADHIGLTGQIVVRVDPALPRAAFTFDWGDGRARFDPAQAEAAVAQALSTALAAEGLHGEPIVLDPESQS